MRSSMTATTWSMTGMMRIESRPFDAEQFSRAKDDELLPGVGHLQRGGDDDRGDHKRDARIKVPCRAQFRAHGEAGDGQKDGDGVHCLGSLLDWGAPQTRY